MKNVFFVWGLTLLFLFFSCKSAPEPAPIEIPEEETALVSVPIDEPRSDNSQFDLPEPSEMPPPEDDPVSIEEPASAAVPSDEPKPGDEEIHLLELDEPEIDLPPEEPAEIPPEDTAALTDHHDDETPSPETSTENLPAQNDESSNAAPPPREEPVPEPPSFLRSADPIEDPNIIRETIPVPVNPIPELPSLPSREDDAVVFSRTVRAVVGQMIEIPFRGSGWTFLGELGSRRGLSYDSRRIDTEGQNFRFLAEQPGTYILKFYREDFVRDYILNDHVQVIIGEAPERSGTAWFNPPSDWSVVVAEPRWPPLTESSNAPSSVSQADSSQSSGGAAAQTNSSLPETGSSVSDEGNDPAPSSSSNIALENSSGTSAGTSAESASTVPRNAAPEEYMRQAQAEFDAGRITGAITILEQFRQQYPLGSDEAYWLLGQCYEANSPSRDIRTSLDYYYRLTNEYPQSRRYSSARARIAYLERYYLNIR